MGFIYKITNLINGKVYVGFTEKTIQERWLAHTKKAKVKTNRYLYDAMNKYGYENFSITEVDSCVSRKELYEKEKMWIKKLDSMNPLRGYNMQEGGIGGRQPDAVYKISGPKLSAANTGKKRSEEFRKQMSVLNKGKVISQECRDKISKTLTGRKLPPEQVQGIRDRLKKHHPMSGKKHSSATIKKMSEFQSQPWDKKRSAEAVIRCKNSVRNRFLGEKNPLYKNVRKEQLFKVFSEHPDWTIKQCAVALNISYPTVYSKIQKLYGVSVAQFRRQILNGDVHE